MYQSLEVRRLQIGEQDNRNPQGGPMAEVSQRAWKLPGQRSKRLAWGFTVTVNGKRVRQYRSEWTKTDAEQELAKVKLGMEEKQPKAEAQAPGITLKEAVERYLAIKSRHKAVDGMK